jgi:hypothetical protein
MLKLVTIFIITNLRQKKNVFFIKFVFVFNRIKISQVDNKN